MTTLANRVCADCGQPFIQYRSTHKFCSTGCRIRSHRRYKHQPEEAAQAHIGIIDYYKQVIGKLSDEQMVQAVFTILTQTPEQNAQRKESILHSLKE